MDTSQTFTLTDDIRNAVGRVVQRRAVLGDLAIVFNVLGGTVGSAELADGSSGWARLYDLAERGHAQVRTHYHGSNTYGHVSVLVTDPALLRVEVPACG